MSSATLPHPLSTPLPVEMAGSSHGWLTRYRRWPVFSPAWARGRVRVVGSVVLASLLLALLPLVSTPARDYPWGGVVQIALQLLAPLYIGPWLGVWVRRRGWPAQQERRALAAAMLAVVAGMLLFHAYGGEPLKQKLAEATGRVDAQGHRKKSTMSIGVIVSSPEDLAERSDKRPEASDTRNIISNGIASALVSFWLGGGAALWGWRRERVGLAALARERELAQARAQRHEAELRLSVLAAQVEPHFLFNTLAGVRSAIHTDPHRASDMVDHLVDYLRASIPRLRSSAGDAATLGEQLEIVRAYFGLMSARMPRLRTRIDTAPGLLALPCPPLMLISLAENAVKHGVEPKIGPALIEVLAQRNAAGGLDITVADDGAGFGASAAGGGLGLANIRERLQQMFQGRAALTLKARPEGGVAATLSLPLD